MRRNSQTKLTDDSTVLPLIQLIYESVGDLSLWNTVLEQVEIALDSQSTVLFTSFPNPATPDISTAARLSPEAISAYAEHYAEVNPLSVACARMFPAGTVAYSDRAVPDAKYVKTEFWADFMRPNALHYAFGIHMPFAENITPAYLTICRQKLQGPYDETHGRLLLLLFPHLQRALKLHLELTQWRSQAASLKMALDALDHAVFGIGPQGQIVFMNSAAEQLLVAGDGIRSMNGRLAAQTSLANTQFRRLLQAASLRGAGINGSAGGSMLLPRRAPDCQPLRVTVTPFVSGMVPGFGNASALVFVSDLERHPCSRVTVLRSLFGLTPAEAKLADRLFEHVGLQQAAESLNVTENSARSQLKAIFRKTGIASQGALIKLLASLPGDRIL